MKIPTIQGNIKRRLLVNYRASPEVVQPLLPHPFRPKLHRGHALVGVCLIRLEQIRPAGFPEALGISSENAAHRIAVEWTDEKGIDHEGVFIPRRDTDSLLNHLAGGRIFPGEHHAAEFFISDDGKSIVFWMKSRDGHVSIRIAGNQADHLPPTSCFDTLADASAYFEGGSLGYSVTHDATQLDGLRLKTSEWRVSALDVSSVYSSMFADKKQFPTGSIEFDHALIMRDIPHEWHHEADLHCAYPQKTI